jgi:hypothetical protein
MTSSLTSEERIEFIDRLKLFMVSDIDRGIKAGLNYLVALGLSTHTEVLGGLCFGNLQSNPTTYG